jgi:hypothetical protein
MLDIISPIISPIVLPFVGTMILNSTVASVIANLIAQLPTLGFASSGSQPFPGLSGWNLTYTINGIVVWDPEVDVYVAAAVNAPSSSLPAPQLAPIFQLTAPEHEFTDPTPIPSPSLYLTAAC